MMRRTRFSLLNLLLFSLVIVLTIISAFISRRNQELESTKIAELQKYHAARVELSNSSKLHFREIASAQPDTWVWDVYVPAKREIQWKIDFVFRDEFGEIRAYSEATSSIVHVLPRLNRQGKLVAKFRKFDSDNRVFFIESTFGRLSILVPNEEIEMLEKKELDAFRSKEVSLTGLGETHVIDETDKPIHVFTLRYRNKVGEPRMLRLTGVVLDQETPINNRFLHIGHVRFD